MEAEAMEQLKVEDDIDEKKGKVYFINNVNTTVGQSLTEEIRNDHLLLGDSLTHTILGTR